MYITNTLAQFQRPARECDWNQYNDYLNTYGKLTIGDSIKL